MGPAGSKHYRKQPKRFRSKATSEDIYRTGYNDDGTLVSGEKLEGSVIRIKDLAIKRSQNGKRRKVEALTENDINIKVDSICVHGDNPKALEFVKISAKL